MEITKVYPLDAVFDSPEDVPEDVILQSLLDEVKFYALIFSGLNMLVFPIHADKSKQTVCGIFKLDCKGTHLTSLSIQYLYIERLY